MNFGQELFRLKVTSEVVINGVIKKVGEVIELAEREARDLLRREKVVPHVDEAAAEPVEATQAPVAPTADQEPAADVAAPAEATDASSTRSRKK